jgi:hypothetical protein
MNPPGFNPRIATAESRRSLSGPGLRTFIAIADLWGLNETDRRLILGDPPRSTYQKWCKTAREHQELTLDVDTLTRISAVLGIHGALQILFLTEADGISWLKSPHKALVFGGYPPIDFIRSGPLDAILTVRRFLDAARGGIYSQPNAIDKNFTPYTDQDIVFK